MKRTFRRWLIAGATTAGTVVACSIALSTTALGNETITYNYDAKGRLERVEHDGTVNDNLSITYNFDDADNRKSVVVSGSSYTANQAGE